jgi:hypothetical protein
MNIILSDFVTENDQSNKIVRYTNYKCYFSRISKIREFRQLIIRKRTTHDKIECFLLKSNFLLKVVKRKQQAQTKLFYQMFSKLPSKVNKFLRQENPSIFFSILTARWPNIKITVSLVTAFHEL